MLQISVQGLGNEFDHGSPTTVEKGALLSKSVDVLQVSCGFNHTAAIICKGWFSLHFFIILYHNLVIETLLYELYNVPFLGILQICWKSKFIFSYATNTTILSILILRIKCDLIPLSHIIVFQRTPTLLLPENSSCFAIFCMGNFPDPLQ